MGALACREPRVDGLLAFGCDRRGDVGRVIAQARQVAAADVVAASDAESPAGELEAEIVGAPAEPVDERRREELGEPRVARAVEGERAGALDGLAHGLHLLGVAVKAEPGRNRWPAEGQVRGEADALGDPAHDDRVVMVVRRRVAVGVGGRRGVGVVGERAVEAAGQLPARRALDVTARAQKGALLRKARRIREHQPVALGE